MFRMLKVIFIVLFVLVMMVSGTDQKSDEGKHFLWQVTSDSTTVYILGSLHTGKKEIYPLAPVIEKAFEKADFLALEVDLSVSENMVKTQQMVKKLGIYGEGKTLKTEIDPELYQKIESAVVEMGLKMEQVQKLKPWLIAFQLNGMKMMKLGFKQELGIDRYFLKKAKGNKPIVSMEKPETQIEAFASLSAKSQKIKMLKEIDDLARMDVIIEKMFKYWHTGDVGGMKKLVFSELRKPEFSEIKKALFDDREIAMSSVIETYLNGNQIAFVVVGAFHLLRDESILGILKRKGYKIKQL